MAWSATIAGAVAHGEALVDAWSVALGQNHRLAAANMEHLAALHTRIAAEAERMPSLSLRSAYTVRSHEPSFLIQEPLPGLGTFEFPYADRNSASASAELRLPLYTSGRIVNSILGADAREQASEFEASRARLDLMFAVGEAYLAVLRAQRDIDVASIERESLAAHAGDVDRLHALQQVPPAELLEAQAASAAATHRLLLQRHSLEVCCGRYNRLLGRPLLMPVQLEEIDLPAPPGNLDQLVQLAHEKRPDLQALVAVANSHYYASQSSRAAARPQISASVTSQYEENRFGDPQALATAAVVLDWNVFDGGKISRSADAQLARSAAEWRLVADLKSQISLDLLDAWNQHAVASEQLVVAGQTLEHAAENLRVSREKFASGVAINSEVLDAQANWSNSMRDYYNAVYDCVFARLRLLYSSGQL